MKRSNQKNNQHLNTEPDWHSGPIDLVIEKLQTSMTDGLSEGEAQARIARYGANELPRPKLRSVFTIFLRQFLSPLIYLLIIAACIAFVMGDEKDAIVILVVLVLNAVVGAFQEGRAEQSLDALRKLAKFKARVVRGGQEQEIEASQVVRGDIIIVTAGDAIPADARLLQAASLGVAEAALTGESLPVVKSLELSKKDAALADRRNMIFAGTYVTAGRGIAVVTATGLRNEIGKIATLATSTSQLKTQLERRIQQFGRYLAVAAVLVFFLVIGIGMARGISFSEIFMIAVSQMVSLVPEGLPVALTIALAVGVQRMARRGTVVRRLSAVETLGSTTVICSDKTGTLTRNEMTVTELYLPVGQRRIEVTGVGYMPEGQLVEHAKLADTRLDEAVNGLLEAAVLCNDAQVLPPADGSKNWRIIGDPTEAALLTAAAKAGIDPAGLRSRYPRKAEIPFDSEVKMMAVQYQIDGENIVYIKGAPEPLFDLCGAFKGAAKPAGNGNLQSEPLLNEMRQAAKRMADSALRVLAVGYTRGTHIDGSQGFAPFSGKLTMLGLIGELDPPRGEVAASVRECLAAGIKPVMVTGDHKATGLAIAKALGISQEGDMAVDGQELDQLSDEALAAIIDKISVFARVHPAQKLRIVQAFQSRGEVVAMTGDGVNDAPALVCADVGVAMGITGSEVAKEAAKIVITDDNFATIVVAVAEGRLVYQNIRKLVLFLFVTSIDEVLVLFLALILGYPPPLAAVQILWINLVSEGALTVNLIMEPAEGDEMKRPPIPLKERLLDKSLLARMPLMVLASVASTFGWFVYRTSLGFDPHQVQTETFTVLVVCQWFNVLNCRSATRSVFSRDLFRNSWLIAGLIIANLLHVLLIYWEPLGRFFHTVPLTSEQFFAIGAVASVVLWVEELRKFYSRKRLSLLTTV